MPYLAKIVLYPIKSLDGVEVEKARVLPSGSLECDRELAIFDENGNFVNGKRHAKIHLLRTEFALAQRTISVQLPGGDSPINFHLDSERQALEAIFSDFFGFKVTLEQNLQMGFPDDRNCSGPTVISTATLEAVASWFPDMNVGQMRRRLRANIEIGGVPAFWEDQLFSNNSDIAVSFRIGDVCFLGIQPCQRCVVPTRNPDSGKADSNFQKIFVQQRQATLPDWAALSRFNHFYKLSINTRLAELSTAKTLQVGDEVVILT
ncbi:MULTISPECIES: MOSC domain-containing protein [Calothrix]|uniref:MOSC N-terminal beta barrel domain-containing protein n=2 Tax=Calothrix TaxID=1186 RepID=A0ABR8AIY8_9CYAN|nr:MULTISPECIES: MOSC N-terminal beta barrel domain-containing protein [Calothrix]MBD2198547.1 MOSC N-terminal beta barrel domain-containing protein [Calothrix parietina FACHB-288]MBD2226998.1 MOSC N-terminal beta barrel domain-containing protein [Calothrix anomala FACHB-343]